MVVCGTPSVAGMGLKNFFNYCFRVRSMSATAVNHRNILHDTLTALYSTLNVAVKLAAGDGRKFRQSVLFETCHGLVLRDAWIWSDDTDTAILDTIAIPEMRNAISVSFRVHQSRTLQPLKCVNIPLYVLCCGGGRCRVGQVGHDPPKILAALATMHLAPPPPIIGPDVR